MIKLDETDPFDAVLVKMVEVNRKKRKDYAGGGHLLQNFYDVAYQTSSTAGDAIEHHIATKQARLRVLLPQVGDGAAPENEPVEDSILDRAIYSVLALVAWRMGAYDPAEQPHAEER